jgi:DNA-binding transcriptional ArsR family regulator
MTRRDEIAAGVFHALSDATRRDVLRCIAERGVATQTEIASELPVSRQAVSKHLAALEDAGLVAAHRSGRELRYELTPGPLDHAVAWMSAVGSEWEERFARLKKHVSKG